MILTVTILTKCPDCHKSKDDSNGYDNEHNTVGGCAFVFVSVFVLMLFQ